jgi:hypothetical protein
MRYPSFEELNTAPDFLLIGRAAMDAMHAKKGFLDKPFTVRDMDADERRAYDRRSRKSWAGRAKHGLGGKRIV